MQVTLFFAILHNFYYTATFTLLFLSPFLTLLHTYVLYFNRGSTKYHDNIIYDLHENLFRDVLEDLAFVYVTTAGNQC